MTDRKIETINVGGAEYAKVSSRLAAFHADHAKCNIATECQFDDGWVIFTATVSTPNGHFVGHSMGQCKGKQKQFEKQESIAVGRALAFAGYLASGEIASAEEMGDVAASVTAAQLNSLKLKYAKENADSLAGLDRKQKSEKFSAWCLSVIGEQVNYRDASSWEPEWYDQCWKDLSGVSESVPFEE